MKVLAETRQRSPYWLLKEAIRQFLEREEAERIRRETWECFEASGETIQHDVIEAWLETWGTDREGKCPPS